MPTNQLHLVEVASVPADQQDPIDQAAEAEECEEDRQCQPELDPEKVDGRGGDPANLVPKDRSEDRDYDAENDEELPPESRGAREIVDPRVG